MRKLAVVACLILVAALSSGSARQAVKRTNVIVILADDLGYGDLSCYGHPRFRTPNIDQMAREGVRLTCVEHVRLLGGESPLPNLMEVKG